MGSAAAGIGGRLMKLLARIERLEALPPKAAMRFILVLVGPNGELFTAADTHPHLPDDGGYTRYLTL
jgi:hypothetical protein